MSSKKSKKKKENAEDQVVPAHVETSETSTESLNVADDEINTSKEEYVEEISLKDNDYNSTIKLKYNGSDGKSHEKYVNTSELSEVEKSIFKQFVLIVKNK